MIIALISLRIFCLVLTTWAKVTMRVKREVVYQQSVLSVMRETLSVSCALIFVGGGLKYIGRDWSVWSIGKITKGGFVRVSFDVIPMCGGSCIVQEVKKTAYPVSFLSKEN